MTTKEQLIKEFREKFAPKAGKPVQGFHEELGIPTSIAQKTTYYLATNPEVEAFLLSAFDAGRASGIEEGKEKIEKLPIPEIGQDGGAWREALMGYKKLILSSLTPSSSKDN